MLPPAFFRRSASRSAQLSAIAFGRRFAVGCDQPRNPQFRAAEAAHHTTTRVSVIPRARASGPEMGLPAVPDGSPSSLARKRSPSGPGAPGVAVVRGIEIALAQGVEQLADPLLVAHG